MSRRNYPKILIMKFWYNHTEISTHSEKNEKNHFVATWIGNTEKYRQYQVGDWLYFQPLYAENTKKIYKLRKIGK